MSEGLDHLVARLAAATPDRRLDGFEAEIGRGIGRWRAEARIASALRSVRFASMALALAIGVTVGGMTIMALGSARAPGLFGSATDLSPSTLLDGPR